MTTSFVEQTVQRALAFQAGQSAAGLITRTPLPDSPFKTKRRPTPSGFEQTPLPTYTRRSTGTTAGQLDVQEQGEGGDGSRGQGYSFFQGSRRGTGYDYSFDIEPIIGGPKGRMGVPTPVEPKFGKSYIGYLADEKFGAKKYYDPVTGTIKSGFPGALEQAIPAPLGFLAGFGQGISQANLERIAAAARIDKDGYAVATLGGRTIGVSPGPFGGYVLSGALPEGITDLQRRQITEKLLEISKTDAASGAYTPEGTGIMPEGVDPSNPTYAGQGQYYSGVGPRPDEGGRPGDPGYVSTPVTSSVSYAEPDPASESMGVGTAGTASSNYGGGSPLGTSRDPGYTGGFRASGGPVGFAEGGTTKKDPIQSTGFVDGPPQNYAKGTTVADTENHRVRVGSFVLNAPTTERLQKEGKLPKGPQKRKAAKGGKMMDVALSKGEYVIDVDDIDKFGGYDALNAENDKGKPEVDRRQAMQKGGMVSRDLSEIRQIHRGDRLARYNEQTGEYELSPLPSKKQQAFIERQESFLQKQPYVHMGDVEYAQSMMAKDQTGSGYIEEGLFMDPMDSLESFKNRGLKEVFPLADAQLINYFTEIPNITYEESIGHPLLAGQYNAQDDTIQIATRGSKYLGSTPEDTAYHEILHRAFEKKFQRNLPIRGSALVEAFSYDQMFVPPAITEDIQKLKLLKDEARFGSAEYEELQSQISNLMSKANDYLPDQNHSALTLHVIDNTLKTVEKGSVKEQIKGLEFARRRARYYLPDSVKSYFDYSQPALLEKKYPDLYALSDDDFNDVRFGLSSDKELNAQYLNYVKDNLKTLKKIHSDATLEYRIALAASDVEDVVAPAETMGSQTYEQGFLRNMLDRNLLQVDAETEYPRYFLEQQRRRDSSATR